MSPEQAQLAATIDAAQNLLDHTGSRLEAYRACMTLLADALTQGDDLLSMGFSATVLWMRANHWDTEHGGN